MRLSIWVAAAWAATVVVFMAIAVSVDGDDDARPFFLVAAMVANALVVAIAVTRHPYRRAALVAVAAGAVLMLTLLGALSIGVFLVPALVFWWIAVARLTPEGGGALVAGAATFGFGLTGVLVVSL